MLRAVEGKSAIGVIRERSGKTQAEIAEALHVEQPTISKWERSVAVPETRNLIRLAVVLGCTVDELIRGVDRDYDALHAHGHDPRREEIFRLREENGRLHTDLDALIRAVTKAYQVSQRHRPHRLDEQPRDEKHEKKDRRRTG